MESSDGSDAASLGVPDQNAMHKTAPPEAGSEGGLEESASATGDEDGADAETDVEACKSGHEPDHLTNVRILGNIGESDKLWVDADGQLSLHPANRWQGIVRLLAGVGRADTIIQAEESMMACIREAEALFRFGAEAVDCAEEELMKNIQSRQELFVLIANAKDGLQRLKTLYHTQDPEGRVAADIGRILTAVSDFRTRVTASEVEAARRPDAETHRRLVQRVRALERELQAKHAPARRPEPLHRSWGVLAGDDSDSGDNAGDCGDNAGDSGDNTGVSGDGGRAVGRAAGSTADGNMPVTYAAALTAKGGTGGAAGGHKCSSSLSVRSLGALSESFMETLAGTAQSGPAVAREGGAPAPAAPAADSTPARKRRKRKGHKKRRG